MAVSRRTRLLVLQRDEFRCFLCGRGAQDGVKLQVDHIQARANQGSDALENLATLCDDCNGGKSDLNIGDYTAIDYNAPVIPPDVPLYRINPAVTGTWWNNFTQQWQIEYVRGLDTGYVQWRWRSCYLLTEWERLNTDLLNSRYITGSIDLSQGPTRDDAEVSGYDLGVEVRYPWGRAWRHELHILPVAENPVPSGMQAEVDARNVTVRVWISARDE